MLVLIDIVEGGSMDKKTCECCKKGFTPRPTVRNQRYCSTPECQKERKRRWQTHKLADDNDYMENQAAAQRAWCAKNSGYWKEYRKKHPNYAERNRIKQRERNQKRRPPPEVVIAKMDESIPRNIIVSGRYRLVHLCNGQIAKMDEFIVEIGVISRHCGAPLTTGP